LLENTTSNDTTTGNAPSIRFYSNDSNEAGIPDNAELGIIEFRGDDKDGGSDRNYAQIKGLAATPAALIRALSLLALLMVQYPQSVPVSPAVVICC
jgi:hypothetical protein